MVKGYFITFEGGEGCGKSTQIKLFADYLRGKGISCLLTREPGGSQGAEEIRALLLKGEANKWDKVTEILLFSAARRDHLVKKIWPTLENGTTVISDRFADSTMAYQGYGYGIDEESIKMVSNTYQMIASNFEPDLTFILDINPEIGIARSIARSGNDEQRFEHMDLTFHHNLRNGFLEIAKQNPKRYAIIDANASIEQVHQDIITQFEERL
ncbi:MAG: dTMP kinase [Alphaproteobacteria bacterium]|nr:dTMP kinase [Alphaproteobacteria bacterium]